MRTPRSLRWFLVASFASIAAFAAVPLELSVKNPLPVLDGGHLVFAFELAARNAGPAPLSIRSIDYAVSVQGVKLFSGTAQGLALAAGAEQPIPVAGFSEGVAEAEVLTRLLGSQKFTYRVTGTVHSLAPGGALIDLAFVASGEGPTPDEVSVPDTRTKGSQRRYSLLNY